MGILSDIPDLTFAEVFAAESTCFMPQHFELENIPNDMLKSRMVNAFDCCAGELIKIYKDYQDNCPNSSPYKSKPAGHIFVKCLWDAIRQYLKGGIKFDHTHIYIPDCKPASHLPGHKPYTYRFSIWDDYQRENIYLLEFTFPH